MMMNEFAGTVRSQKRGSILFAAAVLLIVCVLAVGAVSADTVMVSSFAELQSNISSASDDRTIIVADDVSISDTLTIDNGKNITLRADGTDHTLSRDGFTGNLFRVNSSGKLTITGSGNSNLTLNGTGQDSDSLVYVNGGTFTMSGGILTNNTASSNGGGVYVDNSGTFTMSGGEISNNMAKDNSGGGVYVNDGTFTMSGGTISDNEARDGGGVYGTGGSTFTMERGTISDNTAYYGGGVYLNGGTFTMSGTAKISSNSADNGGGVDLSGGTFTMSGGTISDNTASNGGGVYVSYDGEFEMSSGTISGNTASSIGDGVYVSGIFELSGSSSVDSVYLTSDKVINVTAALTTTQVTGIELESPADGTEVVTGRLQESDISKFKLDSSVTEYELEYQSPDSIVLKLLPYCQVTFDANGGNPTSTMPFTRGEPISPPANLPTRDGYTLTGWYKEEGCTNQWDFTTPVTSDMTLYAGWKEDEPQPTPQPTPTPVPPSGSSGDGNMDNAYRVLFNDGATTLYVVTDLSAGDKLTKPEDPVKDGYTFAGWHKDTACTQAWDFNDGITGSMTLYAKWTPQETVTPTATATVTPTVTATTTITSTPTGDASPAPTSQPDDDESNGDNPNGETTATSGISLPYLIGGIAILLLAILLLLFLLLRHTVTFLIPTGGELEEYRIKVWHGRYINTEDLPALIRTAGMVP